MTTAGALVIALLLGQDAEPPPAASPAAAEAPAPDAPVVAPKPVEAPSMRKSAPDELNRLVLKLKDAPIDERPAILEEIQKKYGAGTASPMVPSSDIDVGKYKELPDVDQAKVIARDFITDLLAGNAAGAASRCGVPFMLEDHRFEHAEDLRGEWARHLRSKRTDLLSLYDIEVLTPADMEKKYGRPPQRLSSWNWRGTGALIAVANVSGRATIMLMRQYGMVWQVVAFHD